MITWPADADSSSLLITPRPLPSVIVVAEGLDKSTVNVSLASGEVSPLTRTVICLVVSELRKLSVLLFA